MDHHVPRAVPSALLSRRVDVITAAENAATEIDDSRLLDRATALGRVLFSQDTDLLVEATRRQRDGVSFGDVIFAHQLRVSVAGCISDLELIAKAGNQPDFVNRVVFLPL